ncbi:hypothetical protein D3C86_1492910 [compost metagenome]
MPMRRMPPRITRPTSTMLTTPVSQAGTPKVLERACAMLLTWTMLPMPKPAKPPNSAKAPPSHIHLRPRPFLIAYIGPPTCSPWSSTSR